jgi:hypothetical protein
MKTETSRLILGESRKIKSLESIGDLYELIPGDRVVTVGSKILTFIHNFEFLDESKGFQFVSRERLVAGVVYPRIISYCGGVGMLGFKVKEGRLDWEMRVDLTQYFPSEKNYQESFEWIKKILGEDWFKEQQEVFLEITLGKI